MSAALGALLLIWAISAGLGILVGAMVFAIAPHGDEDRDAGARIVRTSLVWPLWLAVQIVRAFRWTP